MPNNKNHGGSRPGSGPKNLKPPDQKAVNVTMSMLPAERDNLDAMRGKAPRGKFVAGKLNL